MQALHSSHFKCAPKWIDMTRPFKPCLKNIKPFRQRYGAPRARETKKGNCSLIVDKPRRRCNLTVGYVHTEQGIVRLMVSCR